MGRQNGAGKMDSTSPLILLTNDDGITSDGLTTLGAALPDSWSVYVVAPDRPRNATSHSLTLNDAICVERLDDRRFSTTGTPSDCVNIGVNRLLPRKPDLVLSGINIGGNLCEDVTYSGTVAAALEARLLGIPSVAFSLAARDTFLFVPAARIACEIASRVLSDGLPAGVLWNVNIPNLIDGQPVRIRWTRLGRKYYGDCLEEEKGEQGKSVFRFGKDPLQYIEEADRGDIDWKTIEEGDVSITPLRIDTTDEQSLGILKKGYDGGKVHGQPGVETSPEKHG